MPRASVIDDAFGPIANTQAFDHSHHPAMSPPCGMSEGLPIGMMLIGRAYEEATSYRAAPAFEEHGEAHFVRITRSLVEELAAEKRCIVVGRASAAVLARARDTLHVRIVAPVAYRLQRAILELGLQKGEAERTLEETDLNRSRYHREYYHRDCTDPVNYDIVLNTERVGLDGAAEIIVSQARALGWT